MSRFWIVTADHAGARIFATDKRAGPIEEVRQLHHPDGRLKEGDFISDAPGKSNGGGNSQHPMAHEKAHKQQDAYEFAREIADYLESAREDKQFRELYVISGARFLGDLRRALPEPVRRLVKGEVSKDVIRQDAGQVRRHLPDLL